jgi:hypothetical protein
MNTLVLKAQNAFIKTRSIHDNFMYVRNYARRLHRTKILVSLSELNIKKVIDFVR